MKSAPKGLCGVDRKILKIDEIDDDQINRLVPVAPSDRQLAERFGYLEPVELIMKRARLAANDGAEGTYSIDRVAAAAARQIRYALLECNASLSIADEVKVARRISACLRSTSVRIEVDLLESEADVVRENPALVARAIEVLDALLASEETRHWVVAYVNRRTCTRKDESPQSPTPRDERIR